MLRYVLATLLSVTEPTGLWGEGVVIEGKHKGEGFELKTRLYGGVA